MLLLFHTLPTVPVYAARKEPAISLPSTVNDVSLTHIEEV